jgi:hypothetical protein
MAYNAQNPKWSWFLGVAFVSVHRRFFLEPDRTLRSDLSKIADGEHLLVSPIVLPSGEQIWRQGILELSEDQAVFYRGVLRPFAMETWQAGVWETQARPVQKGDPASLRFVLPRMTIIECRNEDETFSVAAMRGDYELIEAVLRGDISPDS